MSRRPGLALLLAAGVMAGLAALATAFITLAQIERRAAGQRVASVKALLMARAGFEDAGARLAVGQDPLTPAGVYGGEDWNGNGSLDSSPEEELAEVVGLGRLDVDACPPAHALRPSFFVRSGVWPDTLSVEGRPRGYSGRLQETKGPAVYTLAVLPQAGIHVNGGDPTAPASFGYNAVLRRVLGNLAEALDRADGVDNGLPTDRLFGEALMLFRPAPGGWSDAEQIRRMATPVGILDRIEPLLPYLAFDPWIDLKVVRPNVDPNWNPPPSGFVGVHTPSALAEIRVGKRDTPVGNVLGGIDTRDPYATFLPGVGAIWSGKRAYNSHTGSYAPDFERGADGRVVGRAPVDLNWARSRPEVIQALVEGLSGIWLDTSFQDSFSMTYAGLPPTRNVEQGCLGAFRRATLSLTEAQAVAVAFRDHTGFPTWTTEFPDWDRTLSFDSWDEFERFVDLRIPGIHKPQRDLLKANFNPNTVLNKFNPCETTAKLVDKSDLTVYSTEFSFSTPHHGLACTGRILDARGRILAERTLCASVALDQVRLTTQSEFCAEDLRNPHLAGDEAGFRFPGAPGFIETVTGADPTAGSRLIGGNGPALQTYPEPQWPGSPCPPPAPYDGSLQLAAIDTPTNLGGLTFLADWDDRYDATLAAGSPLCELDLQHGPPSRSLLDGGPLGSTAASTNMIYPDGCHSEARRVPGFRAAANFGDGFQGMLSFWYKPVFGPPRIDPWAGTAGFNGRGFTLFSLVRHDAGTSNLNQCFLVGGVRYLMANLSFGPALAGKTWWGFVAENAVTSNDVGAEVGGFFAWADWTPNPRTFWHAHRWTLVTLQWNLRAGTSQLEASREYWLNDTPRTSTPHNTYGLSGPNPSTAQSLTQDGYRVDKSLGPVSFYLGHRNQNPGSQGTAVNTGPADGTLDGLVLLTRTTDMMETSHLATARFPAGRYAKEDVALDPTRSEYRSAPVRLAPGSRLLRTDWTLTLPRIFEAPTFAPDLWAPPNRIFYGTGADPGAGAHADAQVRLFDVLGIPLEIPAMTRSGGRSGLMLPDGACRIGIDIRPRLGDNTGEWDKLEAPLLESPILDDVTLTLEPPGGPRLSRWRETR